MVALHLRHLLVFVSVVPFWVWYPSHVLASTAVSSFSKHSGLSAYQFVLTEEHVWLAGWQFCQHKEEGGSICDP